MAVMQRSGSDEASECFRHNAGVFFDYPIFPFVGRGIPDAPSIYDAASISRQLRGVRRQKSGLGVRIKGKRVYRSLKQTANAQCALLQQIRPCNTCFSLSTTPAYY